MSVFRNLLHTPLPEPLVNVIFKQETDSQDTFTQYFAFDEDVVAGSTGVEFTEITPTTISGYFTSTTCSIIIGTPKYKGIETSNFDKIKFPFYFHTRIMGGLDLYAYSSSGDSEQINVNGSVKVGLNMYNIPSSYEYLKFTSTAATVRNYFTLTQFPFTGIDTFCVDNYNLSDIERLNPASGYSVVCQSILPDNAESSVILGNSNNNLFLEVNKNTMMGLNFKNGNPDANSIPFGESMPTYIGNSKECVNLSGETFPLPEKGTETVSNLSVGDTSKFGLVSSIAVWNRDYSLDSLRQWYEDNCIPLPAVYYDIDRQLLKNTENYGTNYFIDFSGNNLHAVVQNLKPVNPGWVDNSWNSMGAVIECTSPAAGVFHVTKLRGNPTETVAFYIELKNFVGFNSKISIFIGRPAGKENASNALFEIRSLVGGSDVPFSQILTDGVNVIEIPEFRVFSDIEEPTVKISIPDDWWDKDEDGNKIDTNTDFYVVFFPVYDQSKTVGYPTYALPDFTENSWNEIETHNNVSIINYYKVDTTACSTPYDFRNSASTNLEYSTSNIFVIRPFKARFKRDDGGKNISVSIDLHGILNDEDVLIQTFVNSSSTGEITVDFPGAVVFSKGSYTNPVVIVYVHPKGVYEQLPLETYFQFSKTGSAPNLFCYAQIPESLNFGTVIMDMEVSSDIKPEVIDCVFYRDSDEPLGGNNILMAGPSNSNVSFGTETAFTYSNSSQGKSYINGVLNTTNPTSEYFGKHITVANIGAPIEGSNVHYIGGKSTGGQSPFRLHKFMAFKEQLTEKQLVKVLEKYNFYIGN